MVQLLRDQGPAAAPLQIRLEAALAALGQESGEILGREHHRQAVNQITVGNCVLSLRVCRPLTGMPSSNAPAWSRNPPRRSGGIYSQQDFATSDRYRKVVEKIARASRADELTVARRVIELARTGSSEGAAKGHIGYYLVDRGEAGLRKAFGFKLDRRDWIVEWVLAHPRRFYWGSITLVLAALLLTLMFGVTAGSSWVSGFWLTVAALVCASTCKRACRRAGQPSGDSAVASSRLAQT